ncbi:MAG: outer membrane protein assembly factor BamC [Rubrivivax sp.]
MNRFPVVPAARTTALALAVALAGCSSIGDMFSGDKVDYRSTKVRAQPLDVPPDLTQLAKDSRYQSQGGVVSAANSTGVPSAVGAPVSGGPAVAPTARGDTHIERLGNERWLVVPIAPEQLWPQLKAFWDERGFVIASEDPQTGIIETDWAENQAKLPHDFIRSTIGKVFGNLYDTGERDRFRMRVERTATGSEVYIAHRGLEEVYVGDRKDSTEWRPRASSPELEAEMLTRLMVKLGTPETQAKAAVANPVVPAVAAARARLVDGTPATVEVSEGFDRAWRRVGLVLDRTGFTVEDRDRAAGLYFVRYIDPKDIGKEEPGFFSKLFGGGKDAPKGPQRYRVLVKAAGDKTTVTVQPASGSGSAGEAGDRIAGILATEMR